MFGEVLTVYCRFSVIFFLFSFPGKWLVGSALLRLCSLWICGGALGEMEMGPKDAILMLHRGLTKNSARNTWENFLLLD